MHQIGMARASGPGRAVSAAAPATPPALRQIQLRDRTNYLPLSHQASTTGHYRLSGFSSHPKIDPACPATPTSFRDEHHFSSYLPLDSSKAAVSPAYTWDSCQPYITDPKLDVLNSPSLPRNFVVPSIVFTPATPSPPTRSEFAYRTPTRQPRQNKPLLNGSNQQKTDLLAYRESSACNDWDSDPFNDSDDEHYDSDDSDTTVTPTSYLSSVTARRSLSLLRTSPQAETQNRLLFEQPVTRLLIPALAKTQLDDLEDSDWDFKKEDTKPFVTHVEMAPNHIANNGTIEPQAVSAGPPLGTIKVGQQFILESHIRRSFADKRLDAAREANYRLQGVQVIESTREALQLPVKTYNAACTFYHRFRLEHPTPDYNHTEAALASLFVACKVEDTLKKSREILCAHHNLKNPEHQTTQDDKIFDAPSKVIIGLERFIVEAINFDYRVRYPQKVLAKIIQKVLGRDAIVSSFFVVAFKMSSDIYKTYAPLKHSSVTCALVIVQLTSLLTNTAVNEFQALDPRDWHTDEQSVSEVMLDLLDLYTQHGKATKVGSIFDLQAFIDIQITVNRRVDRASLARYMNQCRDCDAMPSALTPSTGSPMSLNTPSATGTNTVKRGPKAPEGGTTRFVFDAEQAVNEKQAYDEYAKDSWEEWEEEVEEPILDPRDERRNEPRGPRGPRGHGRGHGRGGFDPGWNPRNRHDRRRRGGGFF